MKSVFTENFWLNYEKYLSDFQEKIINRVEEWEKEPFHLAFAYERISPSNIWSIRIIKHKVRLFGLKEGNKMIWFFIGRHEEFVDSIPELV